MKELVCMCQVKPPARVKNSVYCGCNAMMRLRRTDDHGWYVRQFVGGHKFTTTRCQIVVDRRNIGLHTSIWTRGNQIGGGTDKSSPCACSLDLRRSLSVWSFDVRRAAELVYRGVGELRSSVSWTLDPSHSVVFLHRWGNR